MASKTGRRAARRWAVGMVMPLLFVAACGRSGDMRIAEGGEGGGVVQAPGTGGPGSQDTAAAGDFGTLKSLCGPRPADFKPTGKQVRGVTDDEIKVTTMGDPGNPIQPGLGQEFFDMADAFAQWCNAAGGINGRKITVNKRDGKLTQAATETTKACQTDFMHVGGGNPLDNTSVKPRVACNLGSIPGYTVTTEAIEAPLQVQPGSIPSDQALVGAYRALFQKYPELKNKVGVLGQNVGTLGVVADRYEAAIEAAGGTVVNKQLAAPLGQEWRTIVEAMKAADVQMLVGAGAFSIDATPLLREMNNSGWAPKVLLSDQSGYADFNLRMVKDLTVPEFYVYTQFWPQELVDKNPVVKLTLDMLHKVSKDARMIYFHYTALNAWLLWATAAKECGADLTVECVLKNAERPDWTAGGLVAPNSVGPLAKVSADPCFAMVEVTRDKGFVYDEELTKPNTDTIFNCSPDNVVKLAQTFS